MAQILEGVAFDSQLFYDALHYFSNGNKLKSVQGGLKWFRLNRQHPSRKFRIVLRSKNKFLNPYSFFGVLSHCPIAGTIEQHAIDTDITDINHVAVRMTTRYNEWNEFFNMER